MCNHKSIGSEYNTTYLPQRPWYNGGNPSRNWNRPDSMYANSLLNYVNSVEKLSHRERQSIISYKKSDNDCFSWKIEYINTLSPNNHTGVSMFLKQEVGRDF